MCCSATKSIEGIGCVNLQRGRPCCSLGAEHPSAQAGVCLPSPFLCLLQDRIPITRNGLLCMGGSLGPGLQRRGCNPAGQEMGSCFCHP